MIGKGGKNRPFDWCNYAKPRRREAINEAAGVLQGESIIAYLLKPPHRHIAVS